MPYSIRIDAERRLIHVSVSGEFDVKDVPATVTEVRSTAVARGFNVLYDIRWAHSESLKKSDIFWMPRKIPVLSSVEARRMRTAVVYAPEQRERVQFWEDAYRNLGLHARAFQDETAALAWLAE